MAVGLLHVFGVAKHAAIVYRNPADGFQPVRVRAKQLTLGSGEQFWQMLNPIQSAGRGVREIARTLFKILRSPDAQKIWISSAARLSRADRDEELARALF